MPGTEERLLPQDGRGLDRDLVVGKRMGTSQLSSASSNVFASRLASPPKALGAPHGSTGHFRLQPSLPLCLPPCHPPTCPPTAPSDLGAVWGQALRPVLRTKVHRGRWL